MNKPHPYFSALVALSLFASTSPNALGEDPLRELFKKAIEATGNQEAFDQAVDAVANEAYRRANLRTDYIIADSTEGDNFNQVQFNLQYDQMAPWYNLLIQQFGLLTQVHHQVASFRLRGGILEEKLKKFAQLKLNSQGMSDQTAQLDRKIQETSEEASTVAAEIQNQQDMLIQHHALNPLHPLHSTVPLYDETLASPPQPVTGGLASSLMAGVSAVAHGTYRAATSLYRRYERGTEDPFHSYIRYYKMGRLWLIPEDKREAVKQAIAAEAAGHGAASKAGAHRSKSPKPSRPSARAEAEMDFTGDLDPSSESVLSESSEDSDSDFERASSEPSSTLTQRHLGQPHVARSLPLNIPASQRPAPVRSSPLSPTPRSPFPIHNSLRRGAVQSPPASTNPHLLQSSVALPADVEVQGDATASSLPHADAVPHEDAVVSPPPALDELSHSAPAEGSQAPLIASVPGGLSSLASQQRLAEPSEGPKVVKGFNIPSKAGEPVLEEGSDDEAGQATPGTGKKKKKKKGAKK